MSWLRAGELLDETVIVFTSDHGEAFAEHGNRGHGKTIYQETMHIPLIIRQPKFFAPGKRNRASVDMIDLSTTIAALAGADSPAYWTGGDLRDANSEKAIFALSHQPGYALTSVTAGNYKMIEDELADSSELFDLGADPDEQHPLDKSSHEKTMEIMTAALAHFRDSSAATRNRMVTGQIDLRTDDIPEDVREQLESLGYIE
jgi:arylsulfatase A-like enzyme